MVLHISPSSGPLHDCLPGAFRDNLEPSPSTFADSGCGLRPVVLQPSPQGAAFHYLRGACLQCSGSRRCHQNVRLDLIIICFVCRSVALVIKSLDRRQETQECAIFFLHDDEYDLVYEKINFPFFEKL